MNYQDSFYSRYSTTHVALNKEAPTLDGFRRKADHYDAVWARLVPRNTGAAIVDLGCGAGSFVWWLSQRGYSNARGIDVSPEQIELAAGLGVQNVEQADIREFLAGRLNSFDALVLRDVLEHFAKEEIVEIVRSCFCALRAGGRIILQVPNAESPMFGRIRYGDFTHEVAFCQSSLRQLLSVTGFSYPQFYSSSALPRMKRIRSLARFGLWKLVEGIYRFLIFAETGRRRSIVTEGIIAVAVKGEAEQA